MDIAAHHNIINETEPWRHKVNTKEDFIMSIKEHDKEVQLTRDALYKSQVCRSIKQHRAEIRYIILYCILKQKSCNYDILLTVN